LTSEKKN